MIANLIEWYIRNRRLVVIAFAFVFLLSIFSIQNAKVDAIPDIGENQQIVFTTWAGRSPKDIEEQVTYPLSLMLQGIPGVKSIRGISAFGFSTIYIVFKDEIDFYWSRSRVLEKLSTIGDELPTGVVLEWGQMPQGWGKFIGILLRIKKMLKIQNHWLNCARYKIFM